MNHQPFEDWLLQDASLTPEQKRQLESHVRTCPHCSALVKTERILRTLRMAAPAQGFVSRFQLRLEARKAVDRKRRRIGTLLFTFCGLIFLTWIGLPYLTTFFASPAVWITALVQWGLYLITTLQAASQAGVVILDVIGDILPPFAWMVLISALGGLVLLWSVSIWRFVRLPQGV